MKDSHFLYSIATLALGSIIAIFVGYITNTLPMHTPRDSAPAIAIPLERKSCGCCTQMTPQEMHEFRKRHKKYKQVTTLLTQYGLEKGLRRIKQFAPEIAEQLEDFTEKNSFAQEH